MQILMMHACSNLFSYDEFSLQRTCIEGDYSKRDIESLKKEYIRAFSEKRISKISITHLDVTPNGEVIVIDNIQGENPLKQYKEINPAAVSAKAARSSKEIAPADTTLTFSTVVDGVGPGSFTITA